MDPRPASLFDGQPESNQLGPEGSKSVLKNSTGLKLATYFWPAPTNGHAPKGVIMLCHGHGAYVYTEFLRPQGPGKPCMYKGSWIERLNKEGYSVCGLDTQSCGFSEGRLGLRNYIENLDDLVADVVQFAQFVSSSGPSGFKGLPMMILGISLGGCIALNAIQQHGELFKGAILLAPMLSLEKVSRKGLNPLLLLLSDFIGRWFPTWPIVAVHRNHLFPHLQVEWDADPLAYHGRTRVRNATEFLRVTKRVVRTMHEMTFPFIIFHGQEDNLCDPDGSQQLVERSQAQDKKLVTCPGMWHVLVKEDGNEKILDQIVDWLQPRLP